MTLLRNASRSFYLLRQSLAAGLAALLLLGTGAAWADPPARAGRIAEVAGTVWLFDPDTKAWGRIQRNQTIGQGDQLRTDTRSRVTVRVGSSTLWLDEQSDMEVLQMDDGGLALRLVTGDIALRLRSAQAAQETRIQTREGVISPEMEGLFRIDQLDRGSRVGVLQGRAQFDSDPGAPIQRAWLREGEQAEFWWADSPRIERQPISRDKFSAWFISRDQAEASLSLGDEPYVSPEMTGAEDLNQYGSWETAAEYGNVWIPSQVAPGWAPYRDGSWVWTRQWGWSWVDNAPWGFAPFHYGRWIQHRGRWAWAPGRFEPRPAYAPALVSWSSAAQVSIGITVGGTRRPPQTGWAPLAPKQIFVPVYPHSPQYVERFQWNKDGPSRGERNDRNPARPPQVRGDNGSHDSRPGQRWEHDSRDNAQRNLPTWSVAAQSAVQPQVLPSPPVQGPTLQTPATQGPQPNLQRDNRDYRNNRNPRDFRDSVEGRDSERPQRNRDPVQQNPAVQQPTPQPQAPRPFVQQPQSQPQPQPQSQVPIFPREHWSGAVQAQRPAAPQPTPPAAQPQATQAPMPQQQPQAQPTRPVDDEKPNGKRNKRENQDRDFSNR